MGIKKIATVIHTCWSFRWNPYPTHKGLQVISGKERRQIPERYHRWKIIQGEIPKGWVFPRQYSFGKGTAPHLFPDEYWWSFSIQVFQLQHLASLFCYQRTASPFKVRLPWYQWWNIFPRLKEDSFNKLAKIWPIFKS